MGFLGILMGFTLISIVAILINSFPLSLREVRPEMVSVAPPFINQAKRLWDDACSLFAANEGGEKTEKASPKKLQDSRKKGQVTKSTEINTFSNLLGAFTLLLVGGSWFTSQFQWLMTDYILKMKTPGLEGSHIELELAQKLVPLLLVGLIPLLVIGLISNIAQIGFVFSLDPLKPNWGKLNPFKGFKEMFSRKRWFDLLKNIGKLTVVIWICWSFYQSHQSALTAFPYMSLKDELILIGNLLKSVLSQILFLVGILAAIDYAFQRYDYLKNLKMTKQETKEEYKQMEGNPFVKGARRQKQRQMAMQRMMSVLPEASVIITNPTHFAVAIRYRHGEDFIPVVLAKGIDYQALRIKEKASELKIPIVENKPLARTLYKNVEVNQEIPFELYQSVADVLVLVFKMQQKRNYRAN